MAMTEPQSPDLLAESIRPYGGACDTCRRRRVKCDGTQPCLRCTKSNVACTYGSVAGRTSSISYARHLEEQVAQLRSLLQSQNLLTSNESSSSQDQAVDTMIGPDDDVVLKPAEGSSNTFFGRFGGFTVLRSLLSSLLLTCRQPDIEVNGQELVDAFRDLTSPSQGYMVNPGRRPIVTIPPKDIVEKEIECALNVGMIGHDCIDMSDLGPRLNHLFSTDPEEYTADDEQTLALVYALIGLGRRYAPLDSVNTSAMHSRNVKSRGFSYIQSSFDLTRTAEQFTLDSVRAIICQVRYLLAAAMVSQAYSRIALGITAAVRMGLHTSNNALAAHFTKEQLFQRRKVFAVINMMDTYLSSILGLPKMLKGIDCRNLIALPDPGPENADQIFIQGNPTSPITESILCQKLNIVLARISEARSDNSHELIHIDGGTYKEKLSVITDREKELQNWHNELPALIDENIDVRALQAQLMLRLWHSMAQIILYRPYLHHLSRATFNKEFNAVGYEYGSKCIQAAMQAVWLVEAFQSRNILHEAIYLISYSLSYSSAILIMFVMTSPHRATISESTIAAWKAKTLMEWLGQYSASAQRCSAALDTLLRTLPST